ncbi:hypothetical protein [Methylocaldum sp.]|uniref:hypothetical protein n=1 Tax=Methylocaldum sp. TaxID=1969727 RepID=UPI002D59940F|nr:hypothetical protein [Methylocaldum sp.]HYE35293.1 hypothetical protein [Methylocaldum sp.]
MSNTKIPLSSVSRIDPIPASDAVIQEVNVSVFKNDSASSAVALGGSIGNRCRARCLQKPWIRPGDFPGTDKMAVIGKLKPLMP